MNVLEPWTDIKVMEKETGFLVDVWGRTYTFEKKFVPYLDCIARAGASRRTD